MHFSNYSNTTLTDARTTPTTSSRTIPSSNGDVTLTGKLFSVFSKASTLLHIFALSQIGGCASQNGLKQQQQQFKKNILKKTDRGNHWGDIRAKLEVDIQEVLSLAIEINSIVRASKRESETGEKVVNGNGCDNESENDDVFVDGNKAVKHQKRLRSISSSSAKSVTNNSHLPSTSNTSPYKHSEKYRTLNIELLTIVRKRLSITLQKLIQHGLRSINETRNLVPFISCFANFQLNNNMMDRNDCYDDDEYCDYRDMHAWELIVEYYNLKNGDYYNETPAQKLSQSYNLDIAGDCMVSNKQVLLFEY